MPLLCGRPAKQGNAFSVPDLPARAGPDPTGAASGSGRNRAGLTGPLISVRRRMGNPAPCGAVRWEAGRWEQGWDGQGRWRWEAGSWLTATIRTGTPAGPRCCPYSGPPAPRCASGSAILVEYDEAVLEFGGFTDWLTMRRRLRNTCNTVGRAPAPPPGGAAEAATWRR
ncbi:hypothetical protein GCM10020229_38280 [Kitasatospora albolonga]